MKQLFTLAEEYGTLDYRAFLTLAVYSGFRSGELMGLEWKDIDWDNNVISVRRTANYTATDGTYTDTPKTKKSVRSLKLPDVVFDRLRELRTQQLENKEIFGTKLVDSDRIFVNKLGKPLYIGEPYKWQKKLTEEHGMKFCDIHSLRHQYVKYTTKKFSDFFEKIAEFLFPIHKIIFFRFRDGWEAFSKRKVRTSRTFSLNVVIATKIFSV